MQNKSLWEDVSAFIDFWLNYTFDDGEVGIFILWCIQFQPFYLQQDTQCYFFCFWEDGKCTRALCGTFFSGRSTLLSGLVNGYSLKFSLRDQ